MERIAQQPEVVHIDTRPDEPIVMESVCMNCQKNGETRMLLTSIPFFKDIVVMSFSCPHCGYKNNEIQPAGSLEDYGVKITLLVNSKKDLERDIVRSDHATVSVPELQLEIPASGKGYLSTLEGFLTSFKEDLEMNQDYRREENPELALQIEDFIRKLEKYINCDDEILPYNFVIDDPSGHSNIKNYMAPLADPLLNVHKYTRTLDQITAMGYSIENANEALDKDKDQNLLKEQQQPIRKASTDSNSNKTNYTQKQTDDIIAKMEDTINKMNEEKPIDTMGLNFKKPLEEALKDKEAMDNEIKTHTNESIAIPTPCPNCGIDGTTRMCVCEIPFFKEIIVMAFTCEHCGYRSSDVKTGGGVSDNGKKMTLHVDGEQDMNRDCFKSETCAVTIQELGLEITQGSLGAVYSTIEGLFLKLIETFEENNPFVKGDSAESDFKKKFNDFVAQLKSYMNGEQKFTLVFDDPLDNSWIWSPYGAKEDPKLIKETYLRTEEQDIDLGIQFLKQMEKDEKEAKEKEALNRID